MEMFAIWLWLTVGQHDLPFGNFYNEDSAAVIQRFNYFSWESPSEEILTDNDSTVFCNWNFRVFAESWGIYFLMNVSALSGNGIVE